MELFSLITLFVCSLGAIYWTGTTFKNLPTEPRKEDAKDLLTKIKRDIILNDRIYAAVAVAIAILSFLFLIVLFVIMPSTEITQENARIVSVLVFGYIFVSIIIDLTLVNSKKLNKLSEVKKIKDVGMPNGIKDDFEVVYAVYNKMHDSKLKAEIGKSLESIIRERVK